MHPPEEHTELPWRVPDSEMDAKAARATGMGFLAVPTGTTPAEIPAQHAPRAMLAGVGETGSALPWQPAVRLARRWQRSTHRAEAPSGARERQPGSGSARTARYVREPPSPLRPPGAIRRPGRPRDRPDPTACEPFRGWRDLGAGQRRRIVDRAGTA